MSEPRRSILSRFRTGPKPEPAGTRVFEFVQNDKVRRQVATQARLSAAFSLTTGQVRRDAFVLVNTTRRRGPAATRWTDTVQEVHEHTRPSERWEATDGQPQPQQRGQASGDHKEVANLAGCAGCSGCGL